MARTKKITSIKDEILKQEEVAAKAKEKYDVEVTAPLRLTLGMVQSNWTATVHV